MSTLNRAELFRQYRTLTGESLPTRTTRDEAEQRVAEARFAALGYASVESEQTEQRDAPARHTPALVEEVVELGPPRKYDLEIVAVEQVGPGLVLLRAGGPRIERRRIKSGQRYRTGEADAEILATQHIRTRKVPRGWR